MQRLVDIQYSRNNMSRARGTFRVQGDTLEVFPPYDQTGYRIEWWGDTVEKISKFDPVTGEIVDDRIVDLTVFPASHYVASEDRMKRALVTIEEELHERLAALEGQGKLLEAERLRMRTSYDLEMMREVGFCSGIENYSRHIDGRSAGTAPYTLLDYFPDDYLVVIDESHVTVPQTRGHVRGRPLTEVHARRARLPAAERDRQPAAEVRGVRRAGAPDGVHVGDAGPYELRMSSKRGRADRAADRARRSRGADPPDEGTGRRPDRGDPTASRGRPARARHHAHEEDGRGPHRLPGRDGHQGAVSALRGRHAPAHRDRARPPARRVRRARRHQPVARGSRPARGLARRDPRRRQGGLPALRDLADPDDRPRGAQRRRHGADVCRRRSPTR